MAAVAGPTQEGSGKLRKVPKELPEILGKREISNKKKDVRDRPIKNSSEPRESDS
jgi:hypothetical protein